MKKFTLVAFVMLLSVCAFAQRPSEKKVKFGVYLGEATALGSFGSGDKLNKTMLPPYRDFSKWALIDEDGKQGYGSIGASIGFDVTYNLPVKGLGIFGGFDFFFNAYNSDIDDAFDNWKKEMEKTPGVSKFDYSLPYVMNLPILFGVSYQYDFNHIVGIFGEAGIGPNFRFISKFENRVEYVNNTPDVEASISYNSATTLGFKIGAGVMMWDRMSIVLDYYSLGSSKIAGYKYGSTEESFNGKNALSVSELVVRVGYHF